MIVELKNPRVPIKPIELSSSTINLEKILENFNGKVPDFGMMGDPLNFEQTKAGWLVIADSINPSCYQNKFWRLVSRLQDVKANYE